MKERKTIGELSAAAMQLESLLEATAIGETAGYAELSMAVGFDVRDHRWLLATARRRLHRRRGFVFEAVPSEGLRNLTDSQKVAAAANFGPVGRMVARKARIAGAATYETLSEPEKATHNMTLAVCAVIKATTSRRNLQRIAGAVHVAQRRLKAAETALMLFSRPAQHERTPRCTSPA